MMDFIIQHNMLSNHLLLQIKEAVHDLPHRFVGLIPFSREITSDDPITGLDHIPYGSTSFIETTHELGWKGLSFDANNFSYDVACDSRGDMLNSDGAILMAGQMVSFLRKLDKDEDIFIRPAHDLKQFSGIVMKVQEAIDFITGALECASSGSYKIEKDFLIVASKPKNILAEWRWFIIGGKVIDGSMYRRHGQLYKLHASGDDVNLAGSAAQDAQFRADKWLPAPCCVMDLAFLDTGETKVIEFNCINGSGFYGHDVRKIMKCWIEHYNDGK